jgi:hypothetical protein
MVVFATPGMLHAGFSLDLFKMWCGDPNNLLIIPGYCVAGTVGEKVLSGNLIKIFCYWCIRYFVTGALLVVMNCYQSINSCCCLSHDDIDMTGQHGNVISP